MRVRSRAPLRLGLAGGGTDVSPFTDTYGGYVLNATIDRYAYASLAPTDDNTIRFEASDMEQRFSYSLGGPIPLNGDLILHKAVYNYIIQTYHHGEPLPVELKTFCEAPPGSGLGSSSTLVVAMLRAFVEYLNIPMDDYLLARTAYTIERKDCGLQGGRQDQYAAAFGGFNFMEFYADERAVINPLRIKNWIITEFESSILLYFTGISRDSANIIAAQSENVTANKKDSLEAMQEIKDEALKMKECLLRGDFDGLISSFRKGWESKKRSAKLISNPCIEESYTVATNAGALAGKVSGAGGGGFMMFIVPPEKRMNVVRELGTLDGMIIPAHFTKNGVQSWWI
ncbi:MAG: dehydrogenase [Desulfobulbus sp.]|jgi:D-glycero-alpha-D-manno-heptose-7-phosphate kinase|uniref:GHMP family kinase ATP-binding protein n=1 Tax=Desulfobulbus sp. TaxID=895 RepID=UPI00283E4D85|nr:GHMP kinase [Desulfobulbus sp.]MDR2548591.1 dehydrogenase [Desulfobulbus sp.]